MCAPKCWVHLEGRERGVWESISRCIQYAGNMLVKWSDCTERYVCHPTIPIISEKVEKRKKSNAFVSLQNTLLTLHRVASNSSVLWSFFAISKVFLLQHLSAFLQLSRAFFATLKGVFATLKCVCATPKGFFATFKGFFATLKFLFATLMSFFATLKGDK